MIAMGPTTDNAFTLWQSINDYREKTSNDRPKEKNEEKEKQSHSHIMQEYDQKGKRKMNYAAS